MSEMDSAIFPNPGPAREIRAQAAAWLERKGRSDWTGEGEAEFNAWLGQSSAHLLAFVRVETAWKRADRLSVLQRPAFRRGATRTKSKISSFLLAVAGVAAVAAVVAVGIVPNFTGASYQTYATEIGGHKIVSLPDGTRIELNTKTILRITAEHDARTVWLDQGEAYFQVAHDAKRSFVVFVGDHRVTDLGTKFVIRRDPEHLEVALLEGRALFDASKGETGPRVILTPGDTVTERNHAVTLTKRPTQDLSEQLGWRRGMLIFKHTTLADAVAEFNRYNVSKIIIANREIGDLTIGGTFQVSNIAVFARSMKVLLGLQIERHGDQTVISR